MYTMPEVLLLVAAIGVVIVNAITAWRQSAKVTLVAEGITRISAKADVIEGHVNSAAAIARAKIESMEQRIVALTQAVTDGEQRAALLAQRVPPSIRAGRGKKPRP